MAGANFFVEFVGGPFDGDAWVVLRPPAVGRIGLPVPICPSAAGRSPGSQCRRQPRLAIYELQAASTRWIYRYIESVDSTVTEVERELVARRRPDASNNSIQGSLFVARDAARRWYVTIDDGGCWWAWNDSSPADRAEFNSLERAVAYIRNSMQTSSAAGAARHDPSDD
ncbi:MAG TPA: hypothetical protein VG713_14420 [Pirellulales bacterium]|nr:hypothetical protein [Pirellulales bacterium]